MSDNDVERRLGAWLHETAPHDAPEGLPQVIDRGLARSRPKGHWAAYLTERSMRRSGRVVVGSPAVRAAYLIAIIVILLALGVASIAVGARYLVSWPVPIPRASVVGLIAYDANGTIFVARSDGAAPQPVIEGLAGAASPVWSPNGAKLAFWAEGSPDALYISEADGSNPVRVAGDFWVATDKPAVWSPDSSELLVSSESGPDRNDERLFIVSADGSRRIQLGQDQPLDPLRRLLPAWSPDGRWISFQGIRASLPADESELYLIRPDGSAEHKLAAPGRYFLPPGPQWRPTSAGPQLVFAGADLRAEADIYLYDADTDRATVFSEDSANEAAPRWSPDGRRIAWFATDAQGNETIRIADADGSSSQTLPASGLGGPPFWPAWSPDGTKIYGSSGDRSAVIVLTVDGLQPPVVLSHAKGQGLPSWQPRVP